MKKLFFSMLAITLLVMICITFGSCNETPAESTPPPTSDESTTNPVNPDPSTAPTDTAKPETDVPGTTTPTEPEEPKPLDPKKNTVVSEAFDYTFRYRDKYFVQIYKNEDGNPLREDYLTFAQMKQEFSVFYTYNEDGSVRDARVDVNDPTLPDEKIELELDSNGRVSKLLRYRAGIEAPTHEIVYDRNENGSVKKETYYYYGIESGYAEYDENGIKKAESGFIKSQYGRYDMTFSYTENGCVDTVNVLGYTYDDLSYKLIKNYKETLEFKYTGTNSIRPDDIDMTTKVGFLNLTRIYFNIKYNSDDQCISFLNGMYPHDSFEYVYDSNGTQYVSKSKSAFANIAYEYDDSFRLVSSYPVSNASNKTLYKYNDYGLISEAAGEKTTVYEYRVDEHGYVRYKKAVSGDNVYEYEYDEHGNTVRSTEGFISESYYNENNIFTGSKGFSSTENFELIWEITDYGAIKTSKNFDADGNVTSERKTVFARGEEGYFMDFPFENEPTYQ